MMAAENALQLEARLSDLQSQQAALHARVSELDATLAEVRGLAAGVEDRITAQRAEVGRLTLAAGRGMTFGSDYRQRRVFVTRGGETRQLSGPRPLDTPRGQADHAKRILDALEQEAAPIRASLATLERERERARRDLGQLGGEIGSIEARLALMQSAERERAEVIGESLDWRDRLAGIMRRAG
jgi:septal ring factor EnvC (AmiA/AmiB activator)